MFTYIQRLGAAVVVVAGVAACDFEVTNPGPTDDSVLDQPEAHQAMANGAANRFFDALNEVSYTTSAVTREMFPSGSTSSFGISNRQQVGHLEYDDEHIGDGWTSAHRGRFIGEDGFARIAETNPTGTAGYQPAVESALWAAYSSRLLGENWCEAAIDGGAIIPRADMLKRAETWFTTAIDAAGTTAALDRFKTAALAGRASVRVQLGDWAGAVTDAAQVPTLFVFHARYETAQQSEHNRIFFAGAGTPYKAVTSWTTVYEEYYTATSDPRTPWIDTGGVGDAAVLMVGNIKVPFYRQQKYTETNDNIRISSGWEMRLIEAEKKLMDGDMAGAMAILNVRRALLEPAQPALAPANITEAWTMFKRERGIELWLEGRRLADLYRWEATNTPGALHVLEEAGSAESYLAADQDLCYPISKSEREGNTNIPDAPSGG